jgi:hypothetical protein
MMFFLFSTVAIAASNPTLTWSNNFQTTFKNKTYQQAFCEKPAGFQIQALCEHLKKNKNSIGEKLVSISAQGNTLTLQDGKQSVEIKRSQNPMHFVVNRKTLDLTQLREPAQLLAALDKALPKSQARSLWMNSAYALDAETPGHAGTMAGLSAVILSYTVDQGLCDKAREFFVACKGNVDKAPEMYQYELSRGKFDKGEIKTKDDDYLRWLIADSNELVYQLYQLEELVKNLNSQEVRARLHMCPAGSGDAEMDVCVKTLADRKAVIREQGKQAEKYKDLLEKYETTTSKLQVTAGKESSSSPASKSTNQKTAR